MLDLSVAELNVYLCSANSSVFLLSSGAALGRGGLEWGVEPRRHGCAGDQAKSARLGLVVGAQAGAGQRREERKTEEEVEAEPRQRATAPGTVGIGRGGSSQRLERIVKRELLERAREGDGRFVKLPSSRRVFLSPC
jgi:hypothetical protein